ncbi:MAG: DUF488 domain-containing protein [Caldilineales bacterium]|nr:DUF488 domain-containing protein [Caldilineales bacterium]
MSLSSAVSSKPRALLFDRQRQLLALLDALGGRAGNLDFQKLLFLYCQEPGWAAAYEFVPYKYGAFSFTSYADRRKLIERGLLADDEHHWELTDAGKHAARSAGAGGQDLGTFARRYKALRGDALVVETYRRYPYYATRSEIAERVLRTDPAALQRIAEARSAPQRAALSTIGYEGRTLESYLNGLLKAGVSLLCDVRRNPISRKYGFSKSTLAKGCEGVGIRYEHLPELGIASEQRRSLETQADYDALFEEYERESLPAQQRALETIQDWIQSGQHVALTCYERLPERCHRHCVAEALEQGSGERFGARHL